MSEPWDDDDATEQAEPPPHGPVRVNAEIDIQRGEIVGELARQILARYGKSYDADVSTARSTRWSTST